MPIMKAILAEIEQNMEKPGAKELSYAVSAVIKSGVLKEGDRLPPIRKVAQELMLSNATVSAAWAKLADSGVIRTDGRRGSIVTSPQGTAMGNAVIPDAHHAFKIDLSTGVPDLKLLPSLGRLAKRLKTTGSQYSYLDPPVIPELKSHLMDLWPYVTDDLLVVDGAMDALQLFVQTHLKFGDKVVVENPTFPALIELLKANNIQIIGIPLNENGIDLQKLEEALHGNVAAVILQPRSHNPTGVTWTHEFAKSVASVVQKFDTFVVESDSADVCPTRNCMSVGRFLPEKVMHIRSFAKSHGPDLRLAAISAPEAILSKIRRVRQLGQGWSSRLLQQILFFMLTDQEVNKQLQVSHEIYKARRREFVEELQNYGIETFGNEGINVWVPVMSESLAIASLAAEGIGVAPGTPFLISAHQRQFIRVTAGLIEKNNKAIAKQVALSAGLKRHPRTQ